MSAYHAELENLHSAVTGATVATGWVREHPRLSAAQQIGIYQEAYHLRLQAVVRSDYPALTHYLGDALFDDLAVAYVRQTPSCGSNLDYYSLGFADFIRERQGDGAATDLAGLESALTGSFMGQDAPPLTAAAFTTFDEVSLGLARFTFRQSVRLLQCTYAVDDYFTAWKSGVAAPDIIKQARHLLLYRQQHRVQRECLSPPEFFVLRHLLQGDDFNSAVVNSIVVANVSSDFMAHHVGQWLGGWLQRGLLRGVITHKSSASL